MAAGRFVFPKRRRHTWVRATAWRAGAPPVGEQYLFASLFHRLRRCAPPPPAKKSYFFNIAIPGRLIKHRERVLQAGNPG